MTPLGRQLKAIHGRVIVVFHDPYRRAAILQPVSTVAYVDGVAIVSMAETEDGLRQEQFVYPLSHVRVIEAVWQKVPL